MSDIERVEAEASCEYFFAEVTRLRAENEELKKYGVSKKAFEAALAHETRQLRAKIEKERLEHLRIQREEDKMKNPIKPIGLFHTPKSSDEIMQRIKAHPPEDRAALTIVMCMTWNLCAAIFDQAIRAEVETTKKEGNRR